MMTRVCFRPMSHRNCAAHPLIILTLAVAGACSGGGETSDYAGGTLDTAATPQKSPAERQANACERVSANIVRCDNPPADPAQQDEQRAALVEQCQGAQMSSELLAAYEGCANGPQVCGPFMSCLEQARKDEVVRRLRVRQDAVCTQAAKVVTRCAESTIPADEIAKRGQVTDAQRKRHSQEYIDGCRESEMSQRQISVFEACLQKPSCDAFVKCIDQANRRP